MARVGAPGKSEAKSEAPPAVRATGTASAAFDYEHESDSDELFLRESARSIAQYRQFIERAGDDPAYAREVERSRQQIEDLNASRTFVLNGIAARKAGRRSP